MTRVLPPELKALRAMNRGMEQVPTEARQRCLEWLVAHHCGLPGVQLPPVVTTSPEHPGAPSSAPDRSGGSLPAGDNDAVSALARASSPTRVLIDGVPIEETPDRPGPLLRQREIGGSSPFPGRGFLHPEIVEETGVPGVSPGAPAGDHQ